MNKLIFILLLALPSSLFALEYEASEFRVYNPLSYDDFLNTIGIPDIKGVSCVGCRRNGSWSYSGIKVTYKGTIKAIARYEGISYKLYTEDDNFYLENYRNPSPVIAKTEQEQSHNNIPSSANKAGFNLNKDLVNNDSNNVSSMYKNTQTAVNNFSNYKYYTPPNNKGSMHDKSRFSFNSPLTFGVTQSGRMIVVYKDKYFYDDTEHSLPKKAISAYISRGYSSDASIVYIGNDYLIYIQTGDKFQAIDIGLNSGSDIKNILSVYKASEAELYIGAYLYRNNLNKSLSIFKVIKNTDGSLQSTEMLIQNSTNGSISLNPDIYLNQGDIILSSFDKKEKRYWSIPVSEFKPSNLNFDSSEDIIDLNVSYSISQPNRRIEQDASGFYFSKDLGKTRYTLNESEIVKYTLQGKVMGTPIVLMITENKLIENKNTADSAAIKKIYASIGFDQFFKGGDGLRIDVSNESIAGTANYTDYISSNTYYFDNKNSSIGVFKTFEQGRFIGLSYSKSKIPSVIGFYSYNERDDIAFFDNNFKTETLTIQSGSDNAQFTNRYLFNHADYFVNWNAGGGAYTYGISRDVIERANRHFYSTRSSAADIGFTINGSISIGYGMQARSEVLKGLGLSLEASYTLNYLLYFDNLSQYKERYELPDNKYVSAFRREEIWHGPQLKAGIVF